ncbi:MAG TPA: hypothetical protein VEA69_04605 [Tepidisphaeraceae bacterium]|nr:hypothetical protein [Tepidisphaeraceae bacterium]
MLHPVDQLLWHVTPILALGCAAEAIRRRSVGELGAALVAIATISTAAAAGWSVYAHYDLVCRSAGRGDGGKLANEPWYRLTREAASWATPDRSTNVARSASAAGLAAIAAALVLRAGHPRRRWPGVLFAVACAVMVWERAAGDTKIPPRLSAIGWHAALGCGLAAAILLVALARGRGRWWVVGGIGALVVASWVGRGWTPRSLAAAMTQPRDLAHVVGVGAVLAGLVVGRRGWAWVAVVGVLVAAWVGVLMMLDGSTGGDPVMWFRGVIVQGRD